ncbi:MAG: hypothetical protein AAF226_19705, partial [Verrucomicrobiota bacterium]
LVIGWGVLLTGFTFLLFQIKEQTDITFLPLAFGMTAYTVGPLLGMFLVALWRPGRGSIIGLVIGAVISMTLVALVRTDIWVLIMNDGLAESLASLPSFELSGEIGERSIKPRITSEWMWPITTIITTLFGLLFSRKVK